MACQIHRIVSFIESRLTPFAVSRLIMLSGVSVRKYGPTSDDNAQDLRKIQLALKSLLSPRDQQDLDGELARDSKSAR
jgi:hypothetical protein